MYQNTSIGEKPPLSLFGFCTGRRGSSTGATLGGKSSVNGVAHEQNCREDGHGIDAHVDHGNGICEHGGVGESDGGLGKKVGAHVGDERGAGE